MTKPRVFSLHFNRLGNSRNSPDIWTVHLSDRCIHTRRVEVGVPVETIYKGPNASQPRAYLKGKGRVIKHRGWVEIV